MHYTKLLRDHDELISFAMDYLDRKRVPSKEGEALLGMLLGMSVGIRDGSLTTEKDSALEAVAVGWHMAQADKGKFLGWDKAGG